MAVIPCVDTASPWHLHVDEELSRDLSGESAWLGIPDALGGYEVDWWSSVPGEDGQPVERGKFNDVDEPEESSPLV